MGYLALYREWRPQRFDEVVGQEHVKRTLINALKTNRIAHAYLFAGPRGTGKTTVAKLLAKAVNCHDQTTVEPCNTCPACRTITEGSSMDVLEIDAASNRRIEEVREIRDRVRYAPAENRYKVYIVDEAHMLTTEAANALLKTLEEPPEHAIFILATTEPHKLLPTILSRCQRFDFQLLPTRLIVERLRQVCQKRGVQASDEALGLIARHAEGALRDALSFLDQVLSFGGDEVTMEEVLSVLGTAHDETFFDFIDVLSTGNVKRVLELVDRVVLEGLDIRQFVQEAVGHSRNLLMVDLTDDPSELVPVGAETMEALRRQAATLGQGRLLSLIDELAELVSRLRWSSQPRLVAEVELLRIARHFGDEPQDRKEHTPEAPAPAPQTAGREDAQPETEMDLEHSWQQVCKLVREESRRAEAWLIPATPDFVEGRLVLCFPSDYELHRKNVRDKFSNIVARAAAEVIGQPVELEFVLKGESRRSHADPRPPGPAKEHETGENGNGTQEPEQDKIDAETLNPLVKQALDIFDGELVEVIDDSSPAEGEQQEEDCQS